MRQGWQALGSGWARRSRETEAWLGVGVGLGLDAAESLRPWQSLIKLSAIWLKR